MTEKEYYLLLRRSLDRRVCAICGFTPNVKLTQKQRLGAHFKKHWKEVPQPKGELLPWYMCPVTSSDFKAMFDEKGQLLPEYVKLSREETGSIRACRGNVCQGEGEMSKFGEEMEMAKGRAEY